MYAYVDESGNTGKNIFDEDQPNFVTAALVTPTNFDAIAKSGIAKLASGTGQEILHASVIGPNAVEDVARPLLNILKRAKAHFAFSLVEKKYLLATKVVDHIFDSGENPTVPWQSYNVRPLRILLVFKVAHLLDEIIAELFWECLMERNEKRCRELLVIFSKALRDRVSWLPDARSRELVGDATSWVIDHPEAIQIHTKTKHGLLTHLPNMVGFANLLAILDELTEKKRRPIKKVTHDRQMQFETTLQAWHELFSNASAEPLHLPGEVVKLQKLPNSEFEISASSDSPGLQVIDTVLWLFQQMIKQRVIRPQSAELLNYALRKGWHSDFSFSGVGAALQSYMETAGNAELSPEQIAWAQEIMKITEENRRKNTEAYEVDGLRPFERS